MEGRIQWNIPQITSQARFTGILWNPQKSLARVSTGGRTAPCVHRGPHRPKLIHFHRPATPKAQVYEVNTVDSARYHGDRGKGIGEQEDVTTWILPWWLCDVIADRSVVRRAAAAPYEEASARLGGSLNASCLEQRCQM
ncbi:hypothetical protein EYF80_035909 [Liparis tanakae]|uniref:Uncharacterized protein n=1 Tax=Liparis tanakae TaxID=230148 RepID=A0A4Z2GJV6_9TELE|nr:hypothetical protein EYF80_035909 [Liparis tanakae]